MSQLMASVEPLTAFISGARFFKATTEFKAQAKEEIDKAVDTILNRVENLEKIAGEDAVALKAGDVPLTILNNIKDIEDAKSRLFNQLTFIAEETENFDGKILEESFIKDNFGEKAFKIFQDSKRQINRETGNEQGFVAFQGMSTVLSGVYEKLNIVKLEDETAVNRANDEYRKRKLGSIKRLQDKTKELDTTTKQLSTLIKQINSKKPIDQSTFSLKTIAKENGLDLKKASDLKTAEGLKLIELQEQVVKLENEVRFVTDDLRPLIAKGLNPMTEGTRQFSPKYLTPYKIGDSIEKVTKQTYSIDSFAESSFAQEMAAAGNDVNNLRTNWNQEIANVGAGALKRMNELPATRGNSKVTMFSSKNAQERSLIERETKDRFGPAFGGVDFSTGEILFNFTTETLKVVKPALEKIIKRAFRTTSKGKQIITLNAILDPKYTFSKSKTKLSYTNFDGKVEQLTPNQIVKRVAKNMRARNVRGAFLNFADVDFIIIDMHESMTQAEQAESILTLGHELGHIVYRDELSRLETNPVMYNRLLKAFEKSKRNAEQYQGKNGFEEWYADQVAVYLFQENKKANNGVESFFKSVARRIKAIWNQLSPMYRRRFKANPEFTAYVNETNALYKTKTKNTKINGKPAPNSPDRFYVRQIVEENVQQTAKEFGANKGFIASLKRKVDKFLRENPDLLPRDWNKAISHFIFTADNRLRKLSSELARQLYDRSGSDDPRGYLNSRGNIARQFKNRLLEILPAGIATEQVQEILLEAEDDRIPTSQLKSPEAKQIRRFLRDFYNDYIEGSGHNQGNGRVEFRENFFPRVLMIEAIRENPELQTALAELLQRKAGTPTFETTIVTPEGEKVLSTPWQEVVENIIENEERNPDDHIDGAEATSVGMSKNRSDLFNLVSNKELREIGVLQDPGMTILKYVDDMVKRVDYQDKVQTEVTAEDRQTIIAARDAGTINESLARALLSVPAGKTAKGWIAAEYMIQRISDPVQREEAKDLIRGMLGKTGLNMSKGARAASSLLLTLNVIAYLSLATIASLPDLAGPVLRSRDFSAFRTAFQQYRYYFKNRAELQQYSRDVGVTTLDSMSMMAINANEMAYMTPGMEKFTDKFFHAIGLEQFTKFTRVFALGMGEKFLINEANRATNSSLSIQERQRSARHLEELGVTAEDVKAWDRTKEAGERYRRFEGESGERVKGALGQFVNESIVRPNSAERPGWASNPYAGIVWQLKSFFYAYGKNIVGGALRDTHSRFSETGSVGDAAVPILIMGTAFLPLTMVGLELREWLKYMFRGGDETALRSDSMDFGEYSAEIIDRSGLLGPWGLLRPMLEAGDFGGSWWVPPLGPTAERVEDIVRGDVDYTTYLPVYSSFR
jgi:DNA/RNA endonuclease YhcR with UshA esterase domain